MAGQVRRAPDRGPARRAAHPEVAERRRAGRWDEDTESKRERRRGGASAPCWRTSTCTMCSTCGPTSGGRRQARGECHHRALCRRLRGRLPAPARMPSGSWRICGSDFAKFNLELHPDKTRLIEFGRFAAGNRKRRGEGKPETFAFLGFTHVCDMTRKGKFIVLRQTMRKRMRAKLKEIKEELRRRLQNPIPAVGQWLRIVLLGHYRYFGVPRNGRKLAAFQYQIRWLWYRALCRRSQRHRLTTERMNRLVKRWLPVPRIVHSYPDFGLYVNNPR